MELTIATPFLAFTLFLFLETAILKLKHESKPTHIKSIDAPKILADTEKKKKKRIFSFKLLKDIVMFNYPLST